MLPLENNKVIARSSIIPRVMETTTIATKWMLHDIVRPINNLWLKDKDWNSSDFEKLYDNFRVNNSNKDEFIKNFFSLEKNQQTVLLKPYIEAISRYFNTVNKTGKTIQIISFRHWERDETANVSEFDIQLNDNWREQAKQLWKDLEQEIKESESWIITALFGTHALLNECICGYLFGYENIHKSRKKALLPTERVKYLFKKNWDDVVLKVTRAGHTEKITKKEFEEKF